MDEYGVDPHRREADMGSIGGRDMIYDENIVRQLRKDIETLVEDQKYAEVRKAMNRSDIFNALVAERNHQDNKHGVEGHSIGAWLLILEFELKEAKEAAIKPKTGRDNVISEVIQCMAVCMACLEQYGVEPIDGRQI